MATSRPPSKPRKAPVQARSAHTVAAIQQACIQVLLAQGAARLTTTRVAERAGVSVGSLYQYYPDKRSLLAAVLEKHLLEVVGAVEDACREYGGRPLDVAVPALVKAFMDAKFAQPDVSRALYAVAAELEGHDLVDELTRRGQSAVCQMLASMPGVQRADVITASFVVTTAMIGPVQMLLSVDAPAPFREKVAQELVEMVSGYLAGPG